MIDAYCKDVLMQASKSFESAKAAAKTGFIVLICTIVYMVVTDLLSRVTINGQTMLGGASVQVGIFGTISGVLIEFIAGINFWLYAKASRQFGAFHICLERSHRYLLANKMSEAIGSNKDVTLEKLVCIMANAPMISPMDIQGAKLKFRDASASG